MENKKLKLKFKALKHTAAKRLKQLAVASAAAVTIIGGTAYLNSQQKGKSKGKVKTELTPSIKKESKETPIAFMGDVLGHQVIKYGDKNEPDSLLIGIRHFTDRETEEPIYIKIDSTCIDVLTHDIKFDKESGNLYFGYHLKILPGPFDQNRLFDSRRKTLETFKMEKGLVRTVSSVGGYSMLEDIRPLTPREKELVDSVNDDNIRKLLEFYYTQSSVPLKHELKLTDPKEAIHEGPTKIEYYDYFIDGKEIEQERIKWEKAHRIKVEGLSDTLRIHFIGGSNAYIILEPDNKQSTKGKQYKSAEKIKSEKAQFKDMVIYECKGLKVAPDRYASIKSFIKAYKEQPFLSAERSKKLPSPMDTKGTKPKEPQIPNPRVINRRREKNK